jgi:DNA invertase Pin-like site-specific DNA recombinase
MNCVAYVRVSSRAQDLGMQRAAIEMMAGSRGDSMLVGIAALRLVD